MIALILALIGSTAFELQGDEAAAFRAELIGKAPAPYQQHYRESGGLLSETDGVTVYRWVDRRGGTSMSRNGEYSSTALSYCVVEATAKDRVIVEVLVYGDTRRCRRMFAVMKGLR